jgi:putative transposase
MWRGHNHEPVLEDPDEKLAYLTHLNDTLSDDIRQHVLWHSFCLMTNHAHETGSLVKDKDTDSFDESCDQLGNWMRNGHSRFGQGFNRRHKRQGKVAYDRPKTTEIEDQKSMLRVMFYADSNPVKAGMVSHPRLYEHSSYRYYAYGEKSQGTEKLTPPKAYLSLGKTERARQAKYRSLCDQYLRKAGLIKDRPANEVEEPHVTSAERAVSEEGEPNARGDPPQLEW